MKDKESGFTLIELLIVVAIMGIFAAIAIPGFVEHRNSKLAEKIIAHTSLTKEEQAAYQKNIKEISAIVAKKGAAIIKDVKEGIDDAKKVADSNTPAAKSEKPKPLPVAKPNGPVIAPVENSMQQPAQPVTKETAPAVDDDRLLIWVPKGYDLIKSEWEGDNLRCYICLKESSGECEWRTMKNIGKNKRIIFKEE